MGIEDYLFPIILLLSILVSFLKFTINISAIILGVISFLIVLGSLAALIQKDTITFIQGFVIAFLISPYGLPKIAMWVTAYIEVAIEILKEI
ncbi:hypothetical protein HMPREF0491_00500 [Lachnospiraceae oral taxon 107 str. F0167]|nr:hypothetical protein HMPREF0491_00500 [Lachnospiraceae oral taxon 107 str. F0167]